MTLLEITRLSQTARTQRYAFRGEGPRSAADIQRYRRYRANSGHYGGYQEVNTGRFAVNAPAGCWRGDINISLRLGVRTGAVGNHSHP